jgi:hypothetical protein
MDAPMQEPTNDEPQIHSIRDYMKDTPSVEPRESRGRLAAYRPEGKPKVISVGNLHYRDAQGVVKSIPSNFAKFVDSEEQPLTRSFKIGEEWVPLELAWVKDCGYLLLRNDGGKQFQVVPTEEQRNEELSRVVEVGYMLKSSLPDFVNETPVRSRGPRNPANRTHHDKFLRVDQAEVVIPPIMPLWLIDVGAKLEGQPTSEPMYLRCRHGETTVTMMAIPR